MCTDCFNILEQFNATRNAWIANQTSFFEPDHLKPEVQSFEVKEIVIEPQFDIIEDSQGEYDYPDEYTELEELNEEKYSVSDDINVEELVVVDETSTSPRKISQKKRQSKSTNTRASNSFEDSKERGKDTYQKLLKKCSECSKMIEKNRMDGHMNKHRNIRPYVCDIKDCGKSFYCKLLLRLHRKSIHTGQSVPCKVCNKTFTSNRSLYSHAMRHKNENRYHCTFCDRKVNLYCGRLLIC